MVVEAEVGIRLCGRYVSPPRTTGDQITQLSQGADVMNTAASSMNERLIPLCIVAGLAGGAAEILWIVFYGALTGLDSIAVARQVVITVLPATEAVGYAPALGVLVHLALSLVLGLCFGFIVWVPYARRHGTAATLKSALVVLAAVWVVNFFVILPALNPSFVEIVPLGVSLLSKLIFGASMGWVLARARNA
jgi:hypothetical protein